MNQARINELYERAHVVHEIPYEGSVVDPTIVSVHKQRVFDRYLFAELIVREICDIVEEDGSAVLPLVIKRHFGV